MGSDRNRKTERCQEVVSPKKMENRAPLSLFAVHSIWAVIPGGFLRAGSRAYAAQNKLERHA